MAKYATGDIRNVALIGHSGSGKTILAEAMLLKAGVVTRLGSIEAGMTVSDYEPEEKEGAKSINCTPLHLSWKDREINLLDTAGYTDFIGSALAALSVAETALMVVNGMTGIEVMTRKHWELSAPCRARMVAITRLDAENARFEDVLERSRELFGAACLPVTLPRGSGTSLSGVENLLGPAEDLSEEGRAARGQVIEAIVAADDALLERYLNDEEISPEELAAAVTGALESGSLIPVFAVSAQKDIGVAELLDFLAAYAPSPLAARPKIVVGEEQREFVPSADGKFAARVFKVTADEYVGKVSFFRVYSGTLKAGGSAILGSTGKSETIPKLYRFRGKEQQEIGMASAGDIIATAKVESLAVGETLTAGPAEGLFEKVAYPVPMVSLAVSPKKQGDEVKLSEALRRLADEDTCFRAVADARTREMVISGMGERHLRAALARMARRFGVEVASRLPKIPYLETITGKAEEVEYTHKKQTGGAGQYARVFISIEPNERGAGYEFIDEIFGGAIDLSFRPSVDKGVRSRMAEGILAGYPVVDIKVSLVDGKTHPVDSKDIAFQIAGREAIKKAFLMARPVLLEPIVEMEIVVPARFMGDITGDIAGRRGRVTGVESLGDMQLVRVEAPQAEVQSYSTQLQSVCAGEGYFSMSLKRYEAVPANVLQGIIARAQKAAQETGKK